MTQDKNVNLSVLQQFKKPEIIERLKHALPPSINIEEFTSNLLIEIHNNPLLQKCSFISLLQVAIDSANFGLIPNSLKGHVWLIPYKNYNKQTKSHIYQAKLQIGYKGYIKKLYDNDITLEVEIVTHEEIEKDRFEELRGSNPSITHKPIRKGIRTKEQIALAYAIAHIHDKQNIIDVMSIEEIEEAAKTEFYNSQTKTKEKTLRGVWSSDRLTDYIEMVKKTLIRRIAKRCPIDITQKMVNYEYEQENNIINATPVKTRLFDSNKVAPKSFIYDDINVLFKNDDNN